MIPLTRTIGRWLGRLAGHLSVAAAAALLGLSGMAAQAGAVDQLRVFVRDVQSGRAPFTQTVTSADGKRKKVSSGEFEFLRPNRFRFAYARPYEQLVVSDGQKVWIYDADLNQASSRPFARAIGATPAALLAGGALDADFVLADEPRRDGIDWARATPKAKDAPFQSIRIGFRGRDLAAVEITDAFGQRSLLEFGPLASSAGAATGAAGGAITPERFRFVAPAGAEVVEQ
jgi:outer membrane lipoprotein carrier protein